MLISEFDFELPPDLIAQVPLAERDRSRMLVVHRATRSIRDAAFADLPALLDPGDLVVINNTRVFPARLLGHRAGTGAQVEAFLIRPISTDPVVWEVLAKPGRALKPGARVVFGQGRLRGEVVERAEEGRRLMRFECDDDFDRVVDAIGNTPLPPYIRREQDETHRLDEPRYQTVYAKERGAVAAPTAGLHFTPRVFDELKSRGIAIAELTHHVGYATFQPVRVEQIEDHHIASETYEISDETAEAIRRAKRAGRRVVAVGTTSTRALESAAVPTGDGGEDALRAERRATDLFIYPGHQFRVVDALLTNFHLPQSSLLMLVSALADTDLILTAYRHAVAARYRFYSFGDCMLVL
jgi:S-adenosylmethionine:tRNA ribosyltransferase-isomerase